MNRYVIEKQVTKVDRGRKVGFAWEPTTKKLFWFKNKAINIAKELVDPCPVRVSRLDDGEVVWSNQWAVAGCHQKGERI